MKNKFTFPSPAAVFLVAVILQPVLLKELHHCLEHHDAAPHCFTFGAEKHLHSEEYAHADCPLCLFHLSPAQLEGQPPVSQSAVLAASNFTLSYKNPQTAPVECNFHLRAPPALT